MASPDLSFDLPAIAPTSNPALTGARAPLRRQFSVDGPFGVTGAIPPALEGSLRWVAPNPISVEDPDDYDPIDGDGMLQELCITGGGPTLQRARLVVTSHLVDALGFLAPPGPLSAAGPRANRRLVLAARRLIALDGRGLGYRVLSSLGTAAVEDFDATLQTPMGVHVVVDPATGGAAFLSWSPGRRPSLRYVEVNGDGQVTLNTPLPIGAIGAEPALGASSTTLAVVESSLLAHEPQGEDDERSMISFDPDRRPCIGLLARGHAGSEITWCASEPGHTSAVASISDTTRGADLVVLRSSPERSGDPSWRPRGDHGSLQRLEVDAERGLVTAVPLDDTDLPGLSVDLSTQMADRRYAYAAGDGGRSVIKYDLRTGDATRHQLEDHLRADQPIFVRDAEGRSDDEGWLAVVCSDAETRASTLVILDASSLAAPPQSAITLPERFVFGAPGLFEPAALR